MLRVIAVLWDPRGYRAWLFGALGTALWFPAGVVGVVALLPDWPRGVRTTAFVVVTVAVIAAAGLATWSRRAGVGLANRLLGAGLPSVASSSGWPSRSRTALWLLGHAVTGAAVTLASGMLLLIAVALPAMWLDGGEVFTFVATDVAIPGDASGALTLPVSAALTLLSFHLVTAASALWRRLAAHLLGPDAAERLAAARRQAEDLARRNRLARELHDSIGHTLTTSTIQAAVAGQLMDTDPDSARRALTTIEESTRLALDDLDYVLGVLRQDTADREPARTLTDLAGLLDRVEAAGTEVRRDLAPDLNRVPPTLSREAYRLVQEATTNALRHAAGQAIDIAVRIDAGRLRIRVANELPTTDTAPEPGRGLLGAAERVHLLGGDFAAEATDGRWQLTASLPLPGRS